MLHDGTADPDYIRDLGFSSESGSASVLDSVEEEFHFLPGPCFSVVIRHDQRWLLPANPPFGTPAHAGTGSPCPTF